MSPSRAQVPLKMVFSSVHSFILSPTWEHGTASPDLFASTVPSLEFSFSSVVLSHRGVYFFNQLEVPTEHGLRNLWMFIPWNHYFFNQTYPAFSGHPHFWPAGCRVLTGLPLFLIQASWPRSHSHTHFQPRRKPAMFFLWFFQHRFSPQGPGTCFSDPR